MAWYLIKCRDNFIFPSVPDLPSGLFPSCISNLSFVWILIFHMCATYPIHLILSDVLIIFDDECHIYKAGHVIILISNQ